MPLIIRGNTDSIVLPERGPQGPPGTAGSELSVATRVSAAASSFSVGTTFLRTAGDAAIGDGGESIFRRDATSVPHNAKFVDALGAQYINKSKEFTPEMLGALGDGTTEEGAKIKDWLEAAAFEKRRAITSVGKTYLIGETITAEPLGDLDIYLAPGTVLKGQSGTFADGFKAVLVIDGRSVGSGVDYPRLHIRGAGMIDSSERPLEPGVTSGESLVVKYFNEFRTEGIWYNGGAAYGDGFSDSGIATQAVKNGVVWACHFTGFDDSALYISDELNEGSNDLTDQRGDWIISWNLFEDLAIACSFRRELRRSKFSNNIVNRCYQGFGSSEVGNNPFPPQELEVVDNRFQDIYTRAIEIRCVENGLVRGNTIQRFALQTPGVVWPAISLLGCKKTRVSGNTVMSDGVTLTSHAACYLSDFTPSFGGTLSVSRDNVIEDNSWYDTPVGVSDNSSTDTNHVGPNRNFGIADPIAGTASPIIRTEEATGSGFGIEVPAASVDSLALRASRPGVAAQSTEVVSDSTSNKVNGFSVSSAAKKIIYNSTTDASNTAVSGGAVGHTFSVLGVTKLQVDAANIYAPGAATTASAANAVLNSGSSPANEFLRSTSSLVYKRDIEPLDLDHAKEVIEAAAEKAIFYRSTAKADNPLWSWYGLGAEEVAEIDPRLVSWGYREDDYETVEVEEEFEIEERHLEWVDGPMVESFDEKRKLVPSAKVQQFVKELKIERRLVKKLQVKPGAVLKPEGVAYDRLGVMMLPLLAKTMREIVELRAEIEGAKKNPV